MEHYLYLFLNLFTISYPFFKSFEDKVSFSSRFKALAVGIVTVGSIFLVWDHFFTKWGVWGFNPDYVMGFYIAGMPIEEWMFFLTVPFACAFVHDVLQYFVKKDIFAPAAPIITPILIIVFTATAIIFRERAYTALSFGLAAIVLLGHVLIFRYQYLGRFYLTYLVHLVPFLLINGVLTAMPVVWYNDAENLGIRIYTVPFDDTAYSMSMLFLNLSIYEWLTKKWALARPYAQPQ
jgi:lycopene cyclase domain-containing protein